MRLKNNNIIRVAALTMSVAGALANADSLSGNGSWTPLNWSAATLAADGSSPSIGTPYWNNASGDGPKANVGWCLAGGGSCSMVAGAPGPLSYYGVGNNSASSMYFQSSGNDITVSLQTLLTTQTSNANGFDVFGYYLAGTAGSAAGVSLVPIFDSRSSALGSSYTISSLSPTQAYGFFIENIKGFNTQFQTNYIYFMDSASNTANGSMPADSLQHFAAFNGGNGTYFLGDVDGDACQNGFTVNNSPCVLERQTDFNNMVVEINTGSSSGTPEPLSVGLVGGGLLVLGAVARRRKSSVGEN